MAEGILSQETVPKRLVHIACSLKGRPGAARKVSRLWSPSRTITPKLEYTMDMGWCIRL